MDARGFVYVGKIDGAHIKADVYFNNNIVSIDGPLWFTLDEWQSLRNMCEENDGELMWATTPVEYEASVGGPIDS